MCSHLRWSVGRRFKDWPKKQLPLQEKLIKGENCWSFADLPTRLYLIVLEWKSAGSMDVHLYYSKCLHRVSRKYGNGYVNKCQFVASEADCRVLMGSYRSLTFVYFKPFPGLKYTAGPDWSNKFLNQWTSISHLKLYRSQPFSDMVGLNSKLCGDKWLHKTDKEE